MAAVRSEIKTRTYETYESRIRNYIVPALGSKKVAHLATEDIRAFKRYLLSFKVVGNRTMAVSTARETMGRFHDIINYAMDGEDSRQYWGITFDPWPRRRFNWPDERERPAPNTYLPYTIEEARRFVLATPQAFRPQILCAILLMLRDGELRAMRWKHLNEEKGLYYVCETHSRQHEFTTTKTASSQAEAPVPKLVLRELREQRKRQSQVRLKKRQQVAGPRAHFHDFNGQCLATELVPRRPKSSISTAAEIRPVSLHTLRKTGASILESLGVSRAETQVALRHKPPSVT